MTAPFFGAPMSFSSAQEAQTDYDDKTGRSKGSSGLAPPFAEEKDTPTALESSHSPFRPPPYQSVQYHRYRTSTSTSASVSTTSSPTTTVSWLGPPSSIETPGTSPDTPASSQSYYGSFLRNGSDARPESRFAPMSSIAQKKKNPKNLALNNLAQSSNTRPIASPPLTGDASEGFEDPGIFSPSFVKPPPPRRKTTNLGLTIKTPSSETFAAAQNIQEVPPTPSALKHAALRQFQSTPSLPLQTSTLSQDPVSAIPQYTSNLTEFPVDETDGLREPEGRLENPDAYPNGPICIYDPHVYLYFEPTAEEASEYDVIFNVASEVKNPFPADENTKVKVTNLKSAVEELSGDRSFSVTPTEASKRPSSYDGSLTTSKVTEYIHIPWEHNTDIVPGTDAIPPLHDIIKIIDDRVTSGKRVLIHCQCGVSRSASLIVAYGLFKNTSITVQEAYDMVKQKSKWIGPNMNLIMQLQEYRNGLLKPTSATTGHQKSGSKVLHGRKDMNDPFAAETSVPQTAPLPQDSSPMKTVPSPIELENMGNVTAGPSSAPSGYHWPSIGENTSSDPPVERPQVGAFSQGSIVNASGQVLEPPQTGGKTRSRGPSLAIRTEQRPTQGRQKLPVATPTPQPLSDSNWSAEFAMSPFRPVEDDPSFGITSPREATFAPLPLYSSPSHQSTFAPLKDEPLPMAPVAPAEDDFMLGLTSPRATSFEASMSTHFPFPPRPVPLGPSYDQHNLDAESRSDLRSRLGFSNNKSASNLHTDFTRIQPVQPLEPSQPVRSPSPLAVSPPTGEQPEFAEALMSPRATEFTSNPFREALSTPPVQPLAAPEDALATGESREATPVPRDPRSPPLKGSSPIPRNILEVLDP